MPGPPASSESMVRKAIPRCPSTGASAANGGPSSTSSASIIRSTETVSSAHAARLVRAVGWCSIVTLPPVNQTACAAGAITAGAAASTPTDRGARSPTAVPRVAAIRRAVSCTSRHGRRAGAVGSPVVMPCSDRVADSSSVARKRDMSASLRSRPAPTPTERTALSHEPIVRKCRSSGKGAGDGTREGRDGRRAHPGPLGAGIPSTRAAPRQPADRRRRGRAAGGPGRPGTPGAHPERVGRSRARGRHRGQRRGRRRAGPRGRRRGHRDHRDRRGRARRRGALAGSSRRAHRIALRPPRRTADRRRRALDQPAVRAHRARRAALRPRRRRRQGRGDDTPGGAARPRRAPAGRRDPVRRGRGGIRLPHVGGAAGRAPRPAGLRRDRHRRRGQPRGGRARADHQPARAGGRHRRGRDAGAAGALRGVRRAGRGCAHRALPHAGQPARRPR